ncbi:YHS domain protein [bacterium BMS3Abin05]|nr:YHS domain protein [bacterium BMS3Abin05]GBE26153.1 YHS domain protein [bacterium BMS3Bbin03]HDZ10860.1 YHS domain-containing protein [Bacteroidota bacterium]
MIAKRIVSAVLVVLFAASLGFAQEKSQKSNDVQAKMGDFPVCNMKMPLSKAAAQITYKGKTYYFCSLSEKAKFQKDPVKYVSMMKEGKTEHNMMGSSQKSGQMHEMKSVTKQSVNRVIDPVCGMKINPKTAKFKTSYKGKTYYFCAKEDLTKFKNNPKKYIK